jgi:hypothetical protein
MRSAYFPHRTRTPDPALRASSAELMQHPFIRGAAATRVLGEVLERSSSLMRYSGHQMWDVYINSLQNIEYFSNFTS